MGPITIQAPTGAQQEPVRRVLQMIFASYEIFTERLVVTRERTLASFGDAPIGASELFLRFPRAARCRHDRRHCSAPGSIVSARWAGRVSPSHMAKQNFRAYLSFHIPASPSQSKESTTSVPDSTRSLGDFGHFCQRAQNLLHERLVLSNTLRHLLSVVRWTMTDSKIHLAHHHVPNARPTRSHRKTTA